MIKPFVIFCLTFAVSSAFNTDQFISKHCIEEQNNSNLYCTGFKWTVAEQKEIQSQKFIISKALKIEFISADIGVLNENLINKFPNAVEFGLYNCNLYLNSSRSSISQVNSRLETLKIQYSVIDGNKDSIAFTLLTGLKSLELSYPSFKNSSEIDSRLLSKNVNLQYVLLSGQHIRNISAKAFDNLRKLRALTIRSTPIKTLPTTLLKNNQNLTTFNFDYNLIETVPGNSFFPSSLQTLALNHNRITFVNDKRFKGLPMLKALHLNNNALLILSPDALKNLNALQILHLENNQLKNITRQHFEKNLQLKEVHISGNRLMSVPNDMFDGLNDLEVIKVDSGL